MGSSVPAPPDYRGAAQQTAQAGADMNRLNTQNAYGARVGYGPEGVTQSFSGPMGDLSNSLMSQAGQSMGQAFNPDLPGVGTGQESMDAAYKAYTSRLDPQWQQREQAEHTRLVNQGLDPSSAAYREAMGTFSQGRNDAYGQAYGQAVGLGQQQRGQDMAWRQQAQAEALLRRQLPMQELAGLQQFLQQPDYNQVAGPDYYGAARDQYGADFERHRYDNDLINQRVGAGVNLAAIIARLAGLGG